MTRVAIARCEDRRLLLVDSCHSALSWVIARVARARYENAETGSIGPLAGLTDWRYKDRGERARRVHSRSDRGPRCRSPSTRLRHDPRPGLRSGAAALRCRVPYAEGHTERLMIAS